MIDFTRHRAESAEFETAYALYRQWWEPLKIARDGLWREEIERPFRLNDFEKNGVDIISVADKPVGLVCVSNLDDELWLREMLVIPDYQGQGIGTQIIDQIKEESLLVQKPLTLHVHKVNTRAQDLYTREAFTIIGENERGTHYKMQWIP